MHTPNRQILFTDLDRNTNISSSKYHNSIATQARKTLIMDQIDPRENQQSDVTPAAGGTGYETSDSATQRPFNEPSHATRPFN